MTNTICHLAIKVADVDAAIAFYRDMFGYEVGKVVEHEGHKSCHMSGAGIHLSLMQYANEDAEEATLAGTGPTIHHFGIEVDDLPAAIVRLEKAGCTIIGDRTRQAVKYRSPDGIVGELFARGVVG